MELMRITDQNPTYCSMIVETKQEKIDFYNAVENCTTKLSDCVNQEIEFSNVYLQKTEVMEKDDKGNFTGVINDAVKIVLITPEGEGIASTSKGVLTSLYALFNIFGTPDTWEEPMRVRVKQVSTSKGRTLKLEVL